MSKFVSIKTELRELQYIKQALNDLKIPFQENVEYSHIWSNFRGKVPLVVNAQGVTFGVRATPQDTFEVIGDDMQLRRINMHLQQIQQRYAYHMVIEETSKAGFGLIEEQVGNDKVIRLTVRRWA
jgi:hypothetical protein